jgi:hypothetical protein
MFKTLQKNLFSLKENICEKCLKLNDVWLECKARFEEWLKRKKISEITKKRLSSRLVEIL